MSVDEPVRSTRVNKGVLVLLTVIATLVGLAPIVLLLGYPQLLLYFAVGSALIALVFVLPSDSSATEPPGFFEFVLGGVGAIFTPAVLGVLWLIVYWAIYGITMLVALLAAQVGLQVRADASLVAFYSTLVLAAILGIGVVVVTVQNLMGQLYPDAAGIRSVFYNLLVQGRRRLAGCSTAALLALAIVLVTFILVGGDGTWFYMLLQVYLVVVSAPLWMASAETDRAFKVADVVDDVSRLLEVAGYQVERFPRTGSADFDPLLTSLDLLAQRGERNVFVGVKAAGESEEPVDWKVGTGLTMASWTLSKQRSLAPENVDRMLVLVDAKADKSLAKIGREEQIKVVHVASEQVKRILEAETGAEEQRQAAQNLLSVSDDPDTLGRTLPASPAQGVDIS